MHTPSSDRVARAFSAARDIFVSPSRKHQRVDPELLELLESRTGSFSEPEFGVKTLVNEDSSLGLPSNLDREPDSALPLPGSATPGGEGRDIGKFEMNTPDSRSDIQPRTLAEPGEERGHPVNDSTVTLQRRTMTSCVVERYRRNDA
jgi:hypothetical protein